MADELQTMRYVTDISLTTNSLLAFSMKDAATSPTSGSSAVCTMIKWHLCEWVFYLWWMFVKHSQSG